MGHTGGVKLWAVCVVAGAIVQSACSSTDGTTPVEVGGSGSAGAARGGAASVGGSAGTGTAGSNAVAGTGNVTNGGGTSGADGASGAAGSSGTSGAGGTSGAAGLAGTAGASGSGGSAGHGGASGSAGSGGTAGTSGNGGNGGSGGSGGSALQFDKYGWPPPAYAATATIAANVVRAYKVTLPASTLDSLGISLGTDSGTYRLALYADAGNVPGSLIKGSDQASVLYGTNTANVDDVALTAGTYWIAFRFSASVAVPYGGNVSTVTSCTLNAALSAASQWPQAFGAATCASLAPSNVWVTTYH